MTALSKKAQIDTPGEIEALLPWHATGALGARDARRVDAALAHDTDLARQYAEIREECAEIVLLNVNLGGPSSRALQKLFAAIDDEPASPAIAKGATIRLLRPRLEQGRIFKKYDPN